jgi:hypothetical protein
MPDRPSLLGPDAGRERLRWQLRAARLLAELLERAFHEGLPPVAWSVQDAGCGLVARCLATDPARRRADFGAWASALRATRSPEHTSDTTTYLRAQADRERRDGRVRVTVLATIEQPDPKT